MTDPLRVCIVGIRGEMGDWFRRYFHAEPGYQVWGTGRGSEPGTHQVFQTDEAGELVASEQPVDEAVGAADLVLISAPLLKTPDVIREFGAWSTPDQLWFDIASIKAPVYEPDAYAGLAAGDIVSVHPVFGGLPRTGPVSIENRVVVLCPHTGERGYALLKELFERTGADLIETTWQEHDRFMAVVQSLTHLNAMALGLTLKQLETTTRDAGRFTSPLFRLLATVAERVLSGNAELYGGIQLANVGNADVLDHYVNALQRIVKTVRDGAAGGSLDAFYTCFAEAREAIPDGVRTQNAETLARLSALLENPERGT